MSNQNPDQSHPTTKSGAPDPATSYERAKPENESPQGTLQHTGADRGKNPATSAHPDRAGPESTSERHTNRPNTDSAENSTRVQPSVNPGTVQHSMKEEEPTGWDQAPTDIHDPRQQRHPRTEGKGGVS